MSTNSRDVDATPEQVWDVLCDGWLYPLWVVGASRMRHVDPTWPSTGARLHHSVGSWPVLVDDVTEVIDLDAPDQLVLRARAWPTGEARVTLRVRACGPGSTVTIEERATSGLGRLVPRLLQDPTLTWRNTETLRRLALLVERRT